MSVMREGSDIRNISVIAHVDHGKTTLSDSLIARAGILSMSKAGKALTLDTGKLEKDKGITIKSTGITLTYEYNPTDFGVGNINNGGNEGVNGVNEESKEEIGSPPPNKIVVNLIDSPGHVDFSPEVTAALRVTDGALVVVDYIEGVCVQTETVLRQALQERIRPVLMINKVDRGILELEVDAEAIYTRITRVLEDFNAIISTYQVEGENWEVSPQLGNVAFGSALFCWGFTVPQFARKYAGMVGVEPEYMSRRLWGDYFYDSESKRFTTNPVSPRSGKSLPRAFCHFILTPIIKLQRAIMDPQPKQEIYLRKIEKINVKLTPQELEGKPKEILKSVMQKWIDVSAALLEMIIFHLPSPKEAQRYRVDYLYEGPGDDECATAIRNCDPEGPLVMFVSKMVPNHDFSRFYAFGRILSGTISAGDKVRILGPKYVPGGDKDLYIKPIQRIVRMMGKHVESITEGRCGNTVGLLGIDKFLYKVGTITTSEVCHPIKSMKYSVSPIVRVAVSTPNKTDKPKLISGLEKLAKAESLVQCYREESGENIIAGSGELHLEICLHDLENEYARVPIIKSEPIVSYRETVTTRSSVECLVKSTNKHNRLYITAEPIKEELVIDIEEGRMSGLSDKERNRILREKYSWEESDTKKIICFGEENRGNILVDQTKGVQYMNEIKEHLVSAFEWCSKEGIICEEPIRGVRINITDAKLHPDTKHRGPGIIIPAAKRGYLAAMRAATPKLVEPIYEVQITAPEDQYGKVFQVLSQRSGQVQSVEVMQTMPIALVTAFMPVNQSFGFTPSLRDATSGQAFPQCSFSHWDVMLDDVFDSDTKSGGVVKGIRGRKGLPVGILGVGDLVDKL